MGKFYTVDFCLVFTEMLPSQLGTVVQLKSYQSREEKYYFLMSLEAYFFSQVPLWLSSTSMALLIFHLSLASMLNHFLNEYVLIYPHTCILVDYHYI